MGRAAEEKIEQQGVGDVQGDVGGMKPDRSGAEQCHIEFQAQRGQREPEGAYRGGERRDKGMGIQAGQDIGFSDVKGIIHVDQGAFEGQPPGESDEKQTCDSEGVALPEGCGFPGGHLKGLVA